MKVADSPSIASRIALAFQSASSTTGTDFGYLVKTASRESNFDAGAKARTSSATGLFQFIESTWLETVKNSGDKHGLGDFADDITRRSDGRYVVSDPARRREILALRKDPEISALMAGELTRSNAAYLESRIGREPSDGELYAAHFLGAGGASKLIRMAESDPDRAADRIFPRQARANRNIFYEKSGAARSVSEVLAGLVSQHDSPSGIQYATVVAANKPVPTPVAKAQAIAAAAGVPDAGSANTVIASRYYRPDEAEGLSDALASAEVAAPRVSTEAVMSRTQRLAATLAEERTEPHATGDVLPASVTAFAPTARAPQVPLAKPEPAVEPTATPPAQDAAVAVAAAESASQEVATEVPAAEPAMAPSTMAAEEPAFTVAQAERSAPAVAPSPASASRGRDAEQLFASGNASARISAAWRASEASTPFQALFRTDEASTRERFDTTFLSAFAARPDDLQAAVEERVSAAQAPEPTQVADARSEGRPFDLTGFLRYQIFKEPEDLVPPA